MLNLHGGFGISQNGRETALGDGEMVLYDTSRPFEGWTGTTAAGPGEKVLLQFPKYLLPLPAGQVEPALPARLSGNDGLGALLAGSLRELAARDGHEHAARIACISLDLLAAVLAQHLHAGPSADTRRHALITRVRTFIDGHLADPELSPAVVAAAHHISTRQLHRLFADQDLGVAGWIRRRRLERSRHDLAALREPVHVVAARWGFPDAAHFSRLFRSTYGMSPTDYRHIWSAAWPATS